MQTSVPGENQNNFKERDSEASCSPAPGILTGKKASSESLLCFGGNTEIHFNYKLS